MTNRTNILNLKRVVAATCALLFSCVVFDDSATAAVLADYQFTTNFDLASTDADAGSVASDFGKGAGFSWSSSALGTPPRSAFLSNVGSVTEATAIATDSYLTFTITPESGFQIDLTTLDFNFQRDSLNGPDSYSLYADEDPGAGGDNFTTQILSGTFSNTVGVNNANFFTYSNDLSTTAFLQGVTDATTLRLYLFGAEASGDRDARIDTVQLDGIASVVPEPSSLMLLLLGSIGAVIHRRGWRRQKAVT